MAIPLSDFYAFSAATGSPVPEDEESRARIAPQVADWRRNQLKAPEQKSDFLSALGTGAAIAGLGAAALLGARALRRPQAVTQAAVRDVTPDVEQTVRRAATYRPEPQTPRPPRGTPAPSVEVTPPPSRVAQPPSRQPGGVSQVDLYKLLETERPQGVVVTDLASLVQPKPQVRSETRLLPAAVEKPDAMSFIGQYFQQKGTAAGSLTDFQRSLSNLMADQAVNAVDAAEDQMTGRIKQQLQRNEDLDMSQVDLMEEVADYNYRQAMEQDEPGIRKLPSQAELMNMAPEDRAVAQGFNPTTVNKLKSLDNDLNLYLQVSPQELGGEGTRFLHISGNEHNLNSPFIQAALKKHNITNEELNQFVQVSAENLKTRLQEFEAKAQPSVPDAPINQVAAQLPDGPPVDQAEGIQVTAQKFAQNEIKAQRRQLIEQRRQQPLDIEYKMYDLVASAAEKGYDLDPNRALAILTNPTIELTTDERSLFSVNPAIGKFALRGQSFDPGKIQTGATLGIKGELLKSVPNIGLDPSSSITQAASGTSIRGRSRVQNMPDEFRLRVSSSGRPIEEDFIYVDEGGTVTAYPGEELTELEMEENIAPYTRLVRNQVTGEMQPEYAPKGMRAVNTAEGKTYFVPLKDPGGIGIYGEERAFASGPLVKFSDPSQERVAGEYTKTALRVPTELPYKERGRDPFTNVSNQGLLRALERSGPTGQKAIQNELQRRQRSQESLTVSEIMRRAQLEGRTLPPLPKQQGPQESYTDPDKYFGYNLWDIVKKQPPEKTVQLNLPSDVIPSTAAAARVRTTPADIAAQQLGEYMAKVYKPRSTPLTSAAVIQPRLFEMEEAMVPSISLTRNQTTQKPSTIQVNNTVSEQGSSIPISKQSIVSTGQSIYNLPMNFAYQGNAIPNTPPTTFAAIQAGLRTSTLRKPGQVPTNVQPGARITAVGPKGERQLLEVTGRRMVTPEMADELSQVERWTPDFLRNYINKVGGGKLEQITYKMI